MFYVDADVSLFTKLSTEDERMVQGTKQDIGGYYYPNPSKTEKAMRPSEKVRPGRQLSSALFLRHQIVSYPRSVLLAVTLTVVSHP